jgi:hypothetical protein
VRKEAKSWHKKIATLFAKDSKTKKSKNKEG